MDTQVLLLSLEDNMMMQEASVHITAVVAVAAAVLDLLDWIGNSHKHLVADGWEFADGDALAQQPHSLH